MRFLFVDRILALSPAESIKGIKHVTPDDYYLMINDKGEACFISSFIGETLGQLAAWNVMYYNQFTYRPVAGVVDNARQYRPVFVGETLFLESYIDSLDDSAVQYHSKAYVGDELVFSIDGALGPLLPMEDFIEDQLIREQFKEIYRPGDCPSSIRDVTNSPSELVSTIHNAISGPMRFDRVLSFEPGKQMTAEKRITRAAPYFPDHFPKRPVLPLTILLECKIQLAQEFVTLSGYTVPYRFYELRKIKMNEFVQPGDSIISYVKVKEQSDEELILAFRSEVDGKRVCVVDVVLRVDK